jgi:hypothetical protein
LISKVRKKSDTIYLKYRALSKIVMDAGITFTSEGNLDFISHTSHDISKNCETGDVEGI